MAWGFSTEPEFEAKLQWMRSFVREQVWPLETLWNELGWEGLRRAAAPLQEQVKQQQLWAAHLDPELGGQGYGQVKLGLMHEILGSPPLAPMVFGNAAPDSGNSEGAGFLIAQQRLYPGRIHHCMRWLGVGRRAFDMLCERALYRESHGATLSKHQTIQNWIADSEAEMTAARLMTLHAAWKMDTEGVMAARKDIGMIKFYGARVLHDVIDRALQAHGALGYSTDLPLEAMYRFARAARIYDGPDEVHRISVARQVLRGYEPPADGVPTEFIPARREAARPQFAAVLAAAPAND